MEIEWLQKLSDYYYVGIICGLAVTFLVWIIALVLSIVHVVVTLRRVRVVLRKESIILTQENPNIVSKD
jgi:hypothetical protein